MQKGLLYTLRFYQSNSKEDLIIDTYYYICNYIKYNVIVTLSPTPDGSIQSQILRRRIQPSPYRCRALVLV